MHYFSGKGCSEFLESMHYCIGILKRVRIDSIQRDKKKDRAVFDICLEN